MSLDIESLLQALPKLKALSLFKNLEGFEVGAEKEEEYDSADRQRPRFVTSGDGEVEGALEDILEGVLEAGLVSKMWSWRGL